jgi:hypothetical protein
VTSLVVMAMMRASGRYSLSSRAEPPDSVKTTMILHFIERAAMVAPWAMALAETSRASSGRSSWRR